LSPCTLDGVPGEVKCGGLSVRENRDAPSFNARFFSRVFHDIRKKRDIVLVDLRGTGKSSPLLWPRATVSSAHRHNAEACIGSMFNQFLDAAAVNAVDARCAAATPPAAFVTPGKQP